LPQLNDAKPSIALPSVLVLAGPQLNFCSLDGIGADRIN